MFSFKKLNFLTLIFVIFFSKGYGDDDIFKKNFEEVFFQLEQNLEIYETTKATNLLNKNEQLIEEFSEIFSQQSTELKLNILSQSIENNLNSLNSSIYFKILGKDFERKSNLDTTNISFKTQFNNLLKNIIDQSYESNISFNDNAFHLSKIIKNGSEELSKDLILIIAETSANNSNSKNVSTNIIYNLYKNSENETRVLSDELEQILIKSSLKELEYETLIKKNKVKKNIRKDNLNKDSIVAISEILTGANSEIASKITNEILFNKNSRKDEIAIKLVEQANVLDNWKNLDNKQIATSRNNFVEKILPEAVKNIDQKKIDKVIKIVQSSELETSTKIVEVVVDSYVKNNNNFFKLENKFFERLQDSFDASNENNSVIINSNIEAETILKSFTSDTISSNLLQNSQLAMAYSTVDINKFEGLKNISPN